MKADFNFESGFVTYFTIYRIVNIVIMIVVMQL